MSFFKNYFDIINVYILNNDIENLILFYFYKNEISEETFNELFEYLKENNLDFYIYLLRYLTLSVNIENSIIKTILITGKIQDKIKLI